MPFSANTRIALEPTKAIIGFTVQIIDIITHFDHETECRRQDVITIAAARKTHLGRLSRSIAFREHLADCKYTIQCSRKTGIDGHLQHDFNDLFTGAADI